MQTLMHASPIHASADGPMRIGDSFGDACRHRGSTLIIIAPPSSSGRCAVCSPQATAWGEREDARRRARAAPRPRRLNPGFAPRRPAAPTSG